MSTVCLWFFCDIEVGKVIHIKLRSLICTLNFCVCIFIFLFYINSNVHYFHFHSLPISLKFPSHIKDVCVHAHMYTTVFIWQKKNVYTQKQTLALSCFLWIKKEISTHFICFSEHPYEVLFSISHHLHKEGNRLRELKFFHNYIIKQVKLCALSNTKRNRHYVLSFG